MQYLKWYKKLLVLLILLGSAGAEGYFYSGESFFNVIDAKPFKRGKLTLTIFNAKGIGTFTKTGTMYANPFSDSLITGKYKKYAIDFFVGFSYTFTKNFAVGLTAPFYIDMWDRKQTSGADLYNWSSYAQGDVKVDFSYNRSFSQKLSVVFNPFIVLPAGECFETSVDTTGEKGIHLRGGLFRDFTTQSYDYGIDIAFNYRVNSKLEIGGQLSYINPYQVWFQGDFFNTLRAGLAVAYKITPNLIPVAELWTSQYQRINVTGRSPVYFNLGLTFKTKPGFTFKIAGILPLTQKSKQYEEELSPIYNTSRFPYRLKGIIPNFTPDFGVQAGIVYTHVFKAYEKGNLHGIVVDGSTEKPIPNAEINLSGEGVTTADASGHFAFDNIKAGMYVLKVKASGYQPAEVWALVKANETTEKKIKLYKLSEAKSVLAGKVVDAETNKPINGATITFPGSAIPPQKTGNSGAFKIKTGSGIYTVRVQAKGYRSEVLSLYLPADQTVEVTVPLEKLERVAVGGIILPTIYFDFDKYRIKREYYPELDMVAQILKQHPEIKLEIQGHCSEEGSDSYNYKLGLKRAKAVKKYLVEKHHISPDRLKVASYGEKNPIVPNDTADHRYSNRRVEFRVIK